MLFENSPKKIESLIAKSADLTNKPFVHSVVKINGEYEIDEEDIDLTVNILCRDKEGKSCLLYTSPSPRDISGSRMPSSA